MDGEYWYCDTGEFVPVYVIDNGITSGHDEFVDLTIDHHDIHNDQYYGSSAPCGTSGHYHGTAVASLIAGKNVGVASRVKLIDLRTYDCSGYTSLRKLISAFNWIVSDGSARWNGPTAPDAYPRQFEEYRDWPVNPDRTNVGVVNLSGFSPAGIGAYDDLKNPFYPYDYIYRSISLEAAVRDVVAAGNVVVTSANNYSSSCANHTPSVLGYNGDDLTGIRDLDDSGAVTSVTISPSVITVGGTDRQDRRWQTAELSGMDSGSNSGPCISMWAPGAEIFSARHYSANAYGRESGTSFAAPLVSGIAARYIEYFRRTNSGNSPSPAAVFQYLTDSSTNFLSDGVNPLISNTVAPDGSAPRKSTRSDGAKVFVGMVHRSGESLCRSRLVYR
jgi:aqualysin 1